MTPVAAAAVPAQSKVEPAKVAHAGRAPLEINLADGLDADEAAVLAVMLNPELSALRATRGQSEAQVLEAGILPNPVFATEISHAYGADSAGTTTALNFSLAYESKPLIARSARQRAAEAELAQVDLSVAWQEWQVAQLARLQVTRLGWVRRRVQLAREEVAEVSHEHACGPVSLVFHLRGLGSL